MNKKVLLTGSFFAMTSIALGAFGAHGLKSIDVLTQYHIDIFNKGAQYQFYHALAILILGVLSYNKISVKWPFVFFIIGIVLFSGSLYLLALNPILKLPTVALGPLTPLGGVSFIFGWVLLMRNVAKS